MLGEDVAPKTCSRGARRGSTSTRCTAPVPATRSPRSSTRPTGCTSRPVRRSRPRASSPSRGTTCRASARAVSRPRQKALIPDPRNDENLIVAQTHMAMINFHNKVVDRLPASVPAGAEVPPDPQAGDAALPVAAAPRLPAADLRAGRGQLRLQQGAQADRAGCGADRSARRCRSSSRSLPSGSATAWSAPSTTGTATSPAPPERLDYMFLFSALGGDLGRREAAARQLDRRLAPDV